nr:carbon monoxide dehydrogenase subunit G [uncultured Roseateles sp.]
MKIENQRELPCSQAQAWAALNDDAVLQACIPGCESLTRTAPDRLEAVVIAAIGPVRARFTGKLALSEINAPTGYKLSFEGQGGAAGFSKGTAEVRLSPVSERCTQLHYEATMQIGGKLAQIGSRIVDAAAQKIIQEFFTRFEAQLTTAPEPAATAAPIQSSWWTALGNWWRGLFGARKAAG